MEDELIKPNDRGLTLSNSSDGIYFYKTTKSRIKNNHVNDNYVGIHLRNSSDNSIESNDASNNNSRGILLEKSSKNIITGNTASNNENGISLSMSPLNTLKNNFMDGNRHNFAAEGQSSSDYYNYIDTSNQVNGKTILYLTGTSNKAIGPATNAGTVYCIDCNRIAIESLNLTNNSNGIYFYNTTRSEIIHNQIGYSDVGINLINSSNNTLANNTVHDNERGILLSNSSNNTVQSNHANKNWNGINLLYSNRDVIRENDAINNGDNGIILNYSSHNRLNGNNASYNGYDGIHLFDSNYTSIIGGNTSHDRNGIVFGSVGDTKDGGTMEGNQDYDVKIGQDVKALKTKPEAEKEPTPKQHLQKPDGNGGDDFGIATENAVTIAPSQPTATEEMESLIRKELEKLRPGQIIFNTPQKMWVGVPKQIIVRISKNISENLTKGIEELGKIENETIKTSYEMNVKLEGGRFFRISPEEQKAKILPDNGFKEWSWDITPLEGGTHTLILSALATIKLPIPPYEKYNETVFKRDIIVEVDWLQWSWDFMVSSSIWIFVTIAAGLLGGLSSVLFKELYEKFKMK